MDDLSGKAEEIWCANTPRWREAIPWWSKIAAKLILSRLPISRRVWQKFGVFSPGFMLIPDYAISVFCGHLQHNGRPEREFTYLEIGPGDSLATAAVAWAHGAAGGWLVDAGAYAARDIAAYRPLFARLSELRDELRLPRDAQALQSCATIAEFLELTHCTYREDGLTGLRAVPTASIDLVMSQATLEHVPRHEFSATIGELHRLMKPFGMMSHQIDFKDHLGGSLHNLRLPEWLWEQPWFAHRSGFYTNRLRLSEIVAIFTAAGFTVEIPSRTQWNSLPLPRHRMARQFRGVADDDLRTSGATLVARKHGA